jgi:hypothetical protein
MSIQIIKQTRTYLLITIFLLLGVLSGCAATGATYAKHISEASPQDASKARLVVFRTRENSQYAARAVSVKVNGEGMGSCEYAGFKVLDVAAGKHTLTVDIWDSPGTCNLPIEIAAGGEYFFEINPRSGNLLGTMLGGIVGAAIESSGKQCGGAFEVTAIEKNVAISKLADLKMSQ